MATKNNCKKFVVVSEKSCNFAARKCIVISKQHNIMDKKVKIKDSAVGSMFAKMIADKKTVSNYIKEHGSLNGFNDENIRLAKPL